MKSGFRFGSIAFILLGVTVYCTLADQMGVDCTSNADCVGILNPDQQMIDGVYARCLPSDQGNPNSAKVCGIIFVYNSKVKRMATTPSCDKCIVRSSKAEMKLCQKYKETYGPSNKAMYNNCFESSTPYLCSTDDGQYVTCSVQAKAC